MVDRAREVVGADEAALHRACAARRLLIERTALDHRGAHEAGEELVGAPLRLVVRHERGLARREVRDRARRRLIGMTVDADPVAGRDLDEAAALRITRLQRLDLLNVDRLRRHDRLHRLARHAGELREPSRREPRLRTPRLARHRAAAHATGVARLRTLRVTLGRIAIAGRGRAVPVARRRRCRLLAVRAERAGRHHREQDQRAEGSHSGSGLLPRRSTSGPTMVFAARDITAEKLLVRAGGCYRIEP